MTVWSKPDGHKSDAAFNEWYSKQGGTNYDRREAFRAGWEAARRPTLIEAEECFGHDGEGWPQAYERLRVLIYGDDA